MFRTFLLAVVGLPLCASAQDSQYADLPPDGGLEFRAQLSEPTPAAEAQARPPRRYFFVGGTSGLDPGLFGLRLGLTPIPELSIEIHAGMLGPAPTLGADLRLRPMARFFALTPTVRYGLGVAFFYGTIFGHTLAGGVEWNLKSGLSVGLDAGATFISSRITGHNVVPFKSFFTVPTGQLSIGWRF